MGIPARIPQVISVWCEADGHEVKNVYYTGFEKLADELPEAALLAYALSNLFRARPRLHGPRSETRQSEGKPRD